VENHLDGWTFGSQKAPQLLVEAFRGVVQAHPHTLLLIAGDGELRGLVEHTIHRLGLTANVRLLGFRNDLPDLLKLSDIFALSSLWEGLGRAMTEAMLLGKPVVVPCVNGIPEIVHHGETGLLYEAGNVQELTTQLCYLLEHPEERGRIGENAQRLTRKLFEVNQMVAADRGNLLQAPGRKILCPRRLDIPRACSSRPALAVSRSKTR